MPTGQAQELIPMARPPQTRTYWGPNPNPSPNPNPALTLTLTRMNTLSSALTLIGPPSDRLQTAWRGVCPDNRTEGLGLGVRFRSTLGLAPGSGSGSGSELAPGLGLDSVLGLQGVL